MKTALVGYTGFVGSNLASEYNFTDLYNTKNIEKAYETNPELLVYAGVRAEKFLANQNQEADLKIIENAFLNIQKIHPEKLVLISTIDVYPLPVEVNEDTPIKESNLQPYGADRYLLEKKVSALYPDALIIRLPGLFGKNIKKNFIYDYINFIPSMLKKEKFEELAYQIPELNKYYSEQGNGFYKCLPLEPESKKILKELFQSAGFSAMNFTDNRGVFQFYNLKHLWDHIKTALDNDIRLLNLASEPIEIGELYEYLTDKKFINHLSSTPPYYNFKSKYDVLFGGKNGYIYAKETVLNEIKTFIQEQTT